MSKDLLKEEIKKFQRIVEYDFHLDTPIDEDDDTDTDTELNQDSPVDSSNTQNEPEMDGNDMNAEPEINDGGDMDTDMSAEPDMNAEPEMGGGNDMGGNDMGDDEVELDVTQLVQGTEEAKASSDRANQQIDQLLNKFDELTQKLNHMSGISTKIDGLEKEMEKRMPTDKEKLELRSLDSYPYSQKLSDYWFDKEGQYDVMDNEVKKPEEYILTQDDVDSDYNDREISKSFDADEYEEEDIY